MLRHRVVWAVVVGAAVVVAACVAKAQNARDEEAAIRDARAAQNVAIAARDVPRIASYWTPDIVATAGLGMVVQGPETYGRAFVLDSSIVYRRDAEQVELSANDKWPLAFEVGTWTGRSTRDDSVLIKGRYSAQWVKQNGRWLIRSEVFVALHCEGEACKWPVAEH